MKNFLTTLIVNGFHLSSVDRIAEGNAIINVVRYDKFGAKINYSFLFSATHGSESLIEVLMTTSSELRSTPVVISDSLSTSKCASYKIETFYDRIGGAVNTGLVLIPNLPDVLESLGLNSVPDGLDGRSDDLLEIYAKESLQYLLSSPARRYGTDRRFESLPDGVVLGKGQVIIQYDSKAYSNGFSFSADDVERFAKYVNDFNGKYAHMFGHVYAFLIISGKFNDSEESIQRRSQSLYQKSQTILSCLKCRELGELVQLFVQFPDERHAINWKTIFSNNIITKMLVEKEMQKIRKDNIA